MVKHQQLVHRAVEQLRAAGIEVSLFLDPDDRQIEMAKILGVHAVELQTARYSEAKTLPTQEHELDQLREIGGFKRGNTGCTSTWGTV